MNKKVVGSIFVLMLVLSITASVAGVAIKRTDTNTDDTLVLVRIAVDNEPVKLPRDMEIVGSSVGEWIEIIIPEKRLQELSAQQIKYEIIIGNVEEYEQSIRGTYHTLAQMESMLQTIASSYPSITSLYSIGTTYEGRDIWCLEITDNPGVDEGEPGVFFMGLHHAREWPTVEICLHIADELTSNYGSDPDITDMVNERRILLVTCVNPDGYYYCHDLGNDWRKNRHPYPGGIGVDLNRNYAGSSDGDPWGAWGSVGAGSISNNPSSEVYCGPSPFSETETQAVRNLFLQYDIHASISWHTHGELVMWPWGYTPSYAPDQSYLMQVGQQIAQRITQQDGTGTYTPEQSCGLYPTTGDTTDWAYGYAHYAQGLPTFAYTIEACSSFHPSSSYLDQIVAENFDGAFYLLQEAENIRDTVTPRVVPPVIDEMTTDPDGDYTVSWEGQNPNANPTKFQLDELTGPSIETDDVESGTGYWDISGFSTSTARYHSSSHSYKSGTGNKQVYSMVTVDPLPVTQGMEVSFWCWYAIEQDYDKAFVEISTNGRSYDVIDSFTGSSGGWIEKQYSLDDYLGKSIFIRFRYITDESTLEEGIYLDDITPVVEWNSITTLSDAITTNEYDITDKQDGVYYYRVKGYNSEHGWGDFSVLEDIEVNTLENDPPNAPLITGTTNGEAGVAYDYTFTATDPDGDDVYYWILWGDGSPAVEWIGPYASEEDVVVSHTFTERGTFSIQAKAKDSYDAESDWGTLVVTMPLNQITQHASSQLILQLLQRILLHTQ